MASSVYWYCQLKRDESLLRSRSIAAATRVEALEQWLRDYKREFEQEEWTRLEIKEQ